MSIFTECKKIPILEIIEKYGIGKPIPKGKKYFMQSPIKTESAPSFCIYPETQSFYDFSNNLGGDNVKLVSIIFGLDALQSANKICIDFGIQEDEHINNKQIQEHIQKREKEREEAFLLNWELNDFFQVCVQKYKYWQRLLDEYGHLFNPDDEPLILILKYRNHFEILCYEFINASYEQRLTMYRRYRNGKTI